MMMGSPDAKAAMNATARFDPFVLLKDLEVRKKVQGAFKSTTRNAWQAAHANSTNPPDVGKYKPLFKQVDSDTKVANIRDIQKNIGEERKVVRD